MEELSLEVAIGLFGLSVVALCYALTPARTGVHIHGRFVTTRPDAVRLVEDRTGRSLPIGKHGALHVWVAATTSATWIIHVEGQPIGSMEVFPWSSATGAARAATLIDVGTIDLSAWADQLSRARVVHRGQHTVLLTPASHHRTPRNHQLLDRAPQWIY